MKIKCLSGLLALLLFCSCQGSKKSSPEPQKPSLKVMSYNIHIGNPPSKPAGVVDLAATAAVIKGENPDLVALQEVDVYTERSGKTLDQAKELAALTGMHVHFAKAINRSGGEYGVALLSRYPILKTEVHSLPVESGAGAELRAAGVIEVEFAANQKLIFVSTHLDHLNDENRSLQARTLIQALDPYNQQPVLVGGDFNMNPTNQIWNIFRERFVLGCTTCPSTFPATNPTTTIDYILLNKKAAEKFKVKRYYTVPDRYASDHAPVVAILEY